MKDIHILRHKTLKNKQFYIVIITNSNKKKQNMFSEVNLQFLS